MPRGNRRWDTLIPLEVSILNILKESGPLHVWAIVKRLHRDKGKLNTAVYKSLAKMEARGIVESKEELKIGSYSRIGRVVRVYQLKCLT